MTIVDGAPHPTRVQDADQPRIADHGGPYPGATYEPPAPPVAAAPPTGPAAPDGPVRGWRVRAAAGVAVTVLAVSAGVTGGYLTHRIEGPTASPASTSTVAGGVIGRSALAAVAAAIQPSVVSINTGSAEGSGVVLSTDGYVLTNNHVVSTARGGTVRLTFADGRTATAAVVGTDPTNDLAVVKAAGVSGLTAATIGDSDSVQVGDTVLAVGSPLGLDGTVTAGIVSGLHRDLGASGRSADSSTISNAIQTDAAINPGNSGGALADTAGRVIGINTAIATDGQSNGNIGVGFAIGSNTAKKVADQIIAAHR
jgi:putative serine protease PepD